MYKSINKSILVLVAVMTVSMAYGQDSREDRPRRGHGQKSEFGMHGLGHQLDLTEDQKEQIKEIRTSKSREQIQRRNQVRELRAQLTTAMSQEQVDKSKVDDLIEQIGALRIEGSKDRAGTMIAIRELLTDEQKLIFDQQKSQRKAKHRFKRSRG